ncbi:MAG: two-CW domain-containing protein [Thermodesulfobacteriota bacterium]
MKPTRCWEYMKCGREKECPAHPDHGFDCWTVEGTVCRGQRQGVYDKKIGGCRAACRYYEGVMNGSIRVTG